MKAVTEKYLSKHFSGADLRLGFHKPPHISVSHLHLHSLVLPIKNEFKNLIIFGSRLLTSIEKVIEELES